MDLVLASNSAIRQKILTDAGIAFRHLTGDGPEPDPQPGESAEDYVVRCAEAKAVACWSKHGAQLGEAIVLGCDQVVRFRGQILRKVSTRLDAVNRLMAFQTSPHELINGLVLLADGTAVLRHVGQVTLTVRQLSRPQVERYVEREQPLASVACYFLEGEGIKLIQQLDGDYHSALGLNVRLVLDFLLQHGVDPFRV